jgi:hypothetical protein
MRIVEIASAEEQLALWKLISDSIWTTIGQQARAEAQQKAAATAQAVLKPKKPKKPKKLPKPILPAKPKPLSPKTNQHKHQSPVPQRAVSRPGPLPARHVPLPSSQPVLPPVRSTAFSQADLHKIQSTMPGQALGTSGFPVSN